MVRHWAIPFRRGGAPRWGGVSVDASQPASAEGVAQSLVTLRRGRVVAQGDVVGVEGQPPEGGLRAVDVAGVLLERGATLHRRGETQRREGFGEALRRGRAVFAEAGVLVGVEHTVVEDGLPALRAGKLLGVAVGLAHAHESGDFVVRYWRPRNIPIFDERGKLIFVLHQAEMVGIGRPA